MHFIMYIYSTQLNVFLSSSFFSFILKIQTKKSAKACFSLQFGATCWFRSFLWSLEGLPKETVRFGPSFISDT